MALRNLKGDIFMFEKIKKGIKGVKRYMEEKVQMCKEMLRDAQNRLIVGLVILGAGVGIGGGLIASAYIRVSE